ncbi:BrnT family toxin [Xylophilus rhododendri]|uniref:BrnT family toxin n=1 Tax=Xylophilus rhododendri TaxID=2697032 RepID=A0A857J1Y8_9BURK|nr:BrnT family toxin [Xylophilus rhododendri]QHI97627.1 BrnT family toxin [Xylophilus rhododendri]
MSFLIKFDRAKNGSNIAKRGLPFELAADFDFDTAYVWQDDRKPYPESRFLALGYLRNRLHVLCYTPIDGGIRVISFRKANEREGARHGFPLTRD